MIHIAFEGPDGAGKTSLIDGLQKWHQNCESIIQISSDGDSTAFESRPWPKMVVARHPGFTDLGNLIQNVLKYPKDNRVNDYPICDMSIQLMMMAEYAQFETVIADHHEQDIIVSDRCNIISAYAYGISAGISENVFYHFLRIMEPKQLDHLFLVNSKPEDMQRRMDAQKKDSFESRPSEFQESVRSIYSSLRHLDYVKSIVDAENITVINNDGSIEDMVNKVVPVLQELAARQ